MIVLEDVIYNFSKDNDYLRKVQPGDTIKFKTMDCFSGQIKSNKELIKNLDFNKVNPATGPVYIEGAKPGDTLVVKIEDIKIGNKGVVSTLPNIGPLLNRSEQRTRILDIHDGYVEFNDLKIAVEPMIGVIGVAPEEGQIPCGESGKHGGNLDNKKITKGTTLYFPVNIDGALFQLGDLHAIMGDGEICGTGLEVSGEVTVKVNLIKNFNIEIPAHKTKDKWYVIASEKTYNDALILAANAMQDLICKAYNWDATDAHLYLSLQGDVEVCQGARPSDWDIILRLGIPKIEDRELFMG